MAAYLEFPKAHFCPARQIALLDGEPKMIKCSKAVMLSATLVAAATIAGMRRSRQRLKLKPGRSLRRTRAAHIP
jgi:hypothetical protein